MKFWIAALRDLFVFMLGLFVLILISAAALNSLEEWDFSDSFYFSAVASTSLGLGDLAPKTYSGKMFVSFYSLFMITYYFYFLSFIVIPSGFQLSRMERHKNKYHSR